MDLELDVLAFPDGTVLLKDEDHVDESARLGRYSRDDAAAIHATGRRLVDELHAGERWWDDRWTTWTPPAPLLVPPTLPQGWDDVPAETVEDVLAPADGTTCAVGGARLDGVKEATEPTRFFDPGTGGKMVLQLEPDGARFRILRPFGYRDPAYADPFIVPADVATFRTDLASIPWFFAWLVPGLGTHLPAVLLHDGLVVGPDGGQDAHRSGRRPRGGGSDPARRHGQPRHPSRAAVADVDGGHPRHRVLDAATALAVGAARRRHAAARRRPRRRGDARPHRRGRRAPLDGRSAVGGRAAAGRGVRGGRAAASSRCSGAGSGGRRRSRGWRSRCSCTSPSSSPPSTAIYWLLERLASAPEGASPSAKANLEEADTSEGMYFPAE